MVARTIICIILLIIALICIVALILLIIQARRLREKRAIIEYLIETEMEEDDDFD